MGADERPTLDAAHRCLANERRRTVIDYLRADDDGTASLDDLIDHVIDQETNSPAPNRERVAIDLYHVSLPMLADYGVIDFDERTETVRYRPSPDLERVMDRESG